MMQEKRNKAIARDVIKGMTLKKASEKYNLSDEQIRRIVFKIMREGYKKRYGVRQTIKGDGSLEAFRHNVGWSLTLIYYS